VPTGDFNKFIKNLDDALQNQYKPIAAVETKTLITSLKATEKNN
jgi:hypothetical protein